MPNLPLRLDMAMVLAPTRTRRLILAFFVVIFFVIYLRSLGFRTEPESSKQPDILRKFPMCLEPYQAEITRLVRDVDGVVTLGSRKPDLLAMVGNGHVTATPYHGDHAILLENGAPLDLNHNIRMKFVMGGGEATLSPVLSVLNLRKGQIDVFHVGENCITVRETIFASHSHESVIAHYVTLRNPTTSKKVITIKAGIESHLDNTQTISVNGKSSNVHSDLVHAGNGESYVAAVGYVLSHKAVEVPAKKTASANLLVSLHSSPLTDVGERSERLKAVSSEVAGSLADALGADLLAAHTESWRAIRSSGLQLRPLQDHLMAKPLSINMTLYYVLSMFRPVPGSEMASHEGCFKGSPTSHSPILWTSAKSLDALHHFLVTWRNELNFGGCGEFIHSSRRKFNQALLRSFVGLLQNENGLALALNPHSMEGYVTIFGMEYENSRLNISIVINTPAHAGYVSVKAEYPASSSASSSPVIYGCDQICASSIVPLPASGSEITFPIKPTNPSTPILYLAKSTQQLVMVRQLLEEHHGLDLHSLEEHPISALFIILVSVVIVAFHVLLFHMIYKEFCSGERTMRRA